MTQTLYFCRKRSLFYGAKVESDENMKTENAEQAGALGLDALAKMPEKTLLDEKELAAALAVAPRTIRRMTARGELPPGVRFGGCRRWFAGRVLSHIEALMQAAEKQAADWHKKISELKA